MMVLALTVFLVVTVSALCSLFEAVLYAVPVSHIESLAHEGHRSGRILKRLRSQVDRPIAAILSLNTIANTAGAAVAGALVAAKIGESWVAYFSGLLTFAILILSEVIPKTAGVVYSRRLAGIIARPLLLVVWLMTPLIWICGLATRLVSRHQAEKGVSEEELIVMARVGLKAGSIEAHEAEVIQNVLSLQSRKAADIMTPSTVIFSLPASLSLETARQTPGMLEHSRIPVFDKDPDDVVGLIHRREVLASQAGKDATVADLMGPVHFVPTTLTLDRLLRIFLEKRQHLLIVVGEFGELAGVVTLEDVLEEILGLEIMDEFDRVADLRTLAHERRQTLLGENGEGEIR